MTRAVMIAALTLTLAAGCRTSKDQESVKSVPDDMEPAATPAPMPLERPIRQSRLGMHSSIASACGIAAPQTFFALDSDEIQGRANARLNALADCLTTGPLAGRSIRLIGHADPQGTDAYNHELGRSRADSVAEYLVMAGVPQDKIVVVSHGERQADEEDPEEWPYDRRVDIRLVDDSVSSGTTGEGTGTPTQQ